MDNPFPDGGQTSVNKYIPSIRTYYCLWKPEPCDHYGDTVLAICNDRSTAIDLAIIYHSHWSIDQRLDMKRVFQSADKYTNPISEFPDHVEITEMESVLPSNKPPSTLWLLEDDIEIKSSAFFIFSMRRLAIDYIIERVSPFNLTISKKGIRRQVRRTGKFRAYKYISLTYNSPRYFKITLVTIDRLIE